MNLLVEGLQCSSWGGIVFSFFVFLVCILYFVIVVLASFALDIEQLCLNDSYSPIVEASGAFFFFL